MDAVETNKIWKYLAANQNCMKKKKILILKQD